MAIIKFILLLYLLLLLILKNFDKILLKFVFKIFRIEESRLNQNLHRIINFQIKTFILFIPFYIFFNTYNFNSYLNLILQNIFKSLYSYHFSLYIFSIKQSLKILSGEIF